MGQNRYCLMLMVVVYLVADLEVFVFDLDFVVDVADVAVAAEIFVNLKLDPLIVYMK
jgi:hypothetical protein